VGDAGNAMIDLIVSDEHSPLYDVWIERGDRNLSVCHVDFHCDMRGLLIDRRRGRARYVWQCDPFMNRLDSGSFLAHAVMSGVVSSLRWVHDDFGGRKYDDLYCVKYETDPTSLPFHLSGRKHWAPLAYEEQTFADWDGPRQDEYLSIDWDGIAFADYDEDRIRRLMAEILARQFRPQGIFVCRSPEYSHPNQALFEKFIAGLEKKFATRAVRLPSKRHPELRPSLPWQIYHRVEHLVLRQMRRFGIY